MDQLKISVAQMFIPPGNANIKFAKVEDAHQIVMVYYINICTLN